MARTLCTVFEDALGLPTGYVDTLTGHVIDVPRMHNDALPSGTRASLDADPDDSSTGMGEHTDVGILTVLWADQERGLQGAGHRGRVARGRPAARGGLSERRWTACRAG